MDIDRTYEIPADRTVENMVAAAKHIEDQVAHVIKMNNQRGVETNSAEIMQTITIARATYETMLPK